MDTDLEGVQALAKLKSEFSDRVLDVSQLGALIRKECPDWSDEQVQALFSEADKGRRGHVRFGDLIDFVLLEPPVVLAGRAFSAMGSALRASLGTEEEEEPVSWESFSSGDPNTRFRWRQLLGRRVVFLFDTSDQSSLFEQLSLLQALQGFPVPNGSDHTTRWKTYARNGTFTWGRAAEITVVLPWYRPCQMERTSRWQRGGPEGKWMNDKPAGEWLDVPTAQTLVRLLATSGPPPPGPVSGQGTAAPASLDGRPLEPLWRPPLELLFLDLHEEEPVQRAAADLGPSVTLRMERLVPHLLDWLLRQESLVPNSTYVLFPDKGAYTRYFSTVVEKLSLGSDHILWMNKRRTADHVEQGKEILFKPVGADDQTLASLAPQDHVIVVDDFTNSGSTLFGAVDLARSHASGSKDLRTSIVVPHTVASYDQTVLGKMLDRLVNLGSQCRYVTTDTIPQSAQGLKGHRQVDVVPLASFLAHMVAGVVQQ